MDLQTYLALEALFEICREASKPDIVKKVHRIADGLKDVPQPERVEAMAKAMSGLSREQITT